MPSFLLERLPETDDELWLVVKALWGVTIPRQQVCPDHVAPFTAFCDAYFCRNSIDPSSDLNSIALWHGSRGLSGKSYLLAVLGITKAVLLGADCNVLGGSLEQSKNVHMHMRNSWYSDNAPRFMIEKDGTERVVLTNKAVIRPLTASQRTVRGPHPPFLLLDEIDEMDLEILDAALGQPLPQKNYLGQIVKPYTTMCSTWQNAEGTFTEIWKRAEEQGIPIYQWCFKESSNPIDGWLTQESIEEKKRTIPAEMWRVEYELGEPSIGNRAFDTPSVERSFSLPGDPIRERIKKDFEELTFAEPERDGVYVVGADWAKERDYTVIAVARVDALPHQLVYYIRLNRRPYPEMIKYFNDAINNYEASAVHDATGLGNVINDLIDDRARGFILSGQKRADMLSEFVAGIENDKWRYPKRLGKAFSEMKFCSVGDLYSSAQEFHLPDTVCAFALMHHLAKRLGAKAVPSVLKKDPNEINKYQKMFEPFRDTALDWDTTQEGVVHRVSQDDNTKYNFMA
jgi:hypothetical protein